MLGIINSHRTIRKYSDKPVADHILTEILNAGTRASTTGNMQVYSIIVTTGKELKEKLWELHFKQNMVMQAPVVLTFCADFNRFSKWCELRKAQPGYDNFLSFFTAAIDALLVAQNVALAAESNGMGICYLGTTTYNAGRIIDILKLPRLVIPVTTIVMGYPDETPGLTDRLPMKGIVHKETYQDYTPNDIEEIYFDKESLESTRELLNLNNKETLAQIFTDNRYTRRDNVAFSQSLLKVLESQGFMNND